MIHVTEPARNPAKDVLVVVSRTFSVLRDTNIAHNPQYKPVDFADISPSTSVCRFRPITPRRGLCIKVITSLEPIWLFFTIRRGIVYRRITTENSRARWLTPLQLNLMDAYLIQPTILAEQTHEYS